MCPIGQRARIRLLPGALQLKADLHDDLIARFDDATETGMTMARTRAPTT
jgi:hypothetical protein